MSRPSIGDRAGVPRGACRRSPRRARAWPLPSTPAMPTISPARTVSDTPRTASRCAVVDDVQVVHLEHRLARPRRRLRDLEQHLAADHQLGQAALGGALGGDRRDLHAAPQHGHAVGDLQHLVELVRDQDDGGAARAQLAQHLEQLERLLRRQHRGRLVEHQQARVAVERLQDLGPLLHADADVLHPRGRDRPAGRSGRTVRATRRSASAMSMNGAAAGLGREDDVLGHRHHRDQHEVLVHHADAGLDGVGAGGEVLGRALEHDLALVGPVQAVQAVHQRRLARAVLAEQRVHLARPHVEIDAVVRGEVAEALRDAPELEHRGARAPGRHCGDIAQRAASPRVGSLRDLGRDVDRSRP